MKFYKLTYVLEDEYVEKLAARILNFLEVEINRLEKNN